MNDYYQKLLQGCESEELHLSGYIQPHGAIIVYDTTGIITHISENINEYCCFLYDELLGSDIHKIFPDSDKLTRFLPPKIGAYTDVYGYVFENGFKGDCVFHRIESGIMIEIEQSSNEENHCIEEMSIKDIPSTYEELITLSQHVTQSIQRMTGFERVMAYQFLDDWNGVVIAEQTTKALGSYLGLRFPASDIPLIARTLYTKNSSRHIPHTQVSTHKIISLTHTPLNLTYADLRSVSLVHLEYLANMGVLASCSFSVLSLTTLWGLIACHHSQPLYISLKTRRRCEQLIQNFGVVVSSFKVESRMKIIDSIDRKIENILMEINEFDDSFEGIQHHAGLLLEVFNAHGLVLSRDNEMIMIGDVPSQETMTIIDDYMQNFSEVMMTHDNLCSLFPYSSEDIQRASGMLCLKAKSRHYKKSYFYWFRKEEPSEVLWAGNPDKPENENPHAIALSPRKSFEQWIEVKKGFSRPWSSVDIMIANKFKCIVPRWV